MSQFPREGGQIVAFRRPASQIALGSPSGWVQSATGSYTARMPEATGKPQPREAHTREPHRREALRSEGQSPDAQSRGRDVLSEPAIDQGTSPASRPELWRTFVAIELPGQLKKKLADIRHRLPVGPARAIRWIPPDGIHLTLRFLGDIEPARVPQVADRMTAAAAQTGKFWLALASPGAFPPSGPPRVFWVGLTGELQRLGSLQARIEGGLSTLGFEPDRRPFHPHLTVGRISTGARTREALDARAAFTRVQIEPGQRFDARSVTLWRSHLLEAGARYEALATADFA